MDKKDNRFYLCGACHRRRPQEKIEMVQDEEHPEHGAYPICSDTEMCTIELVRERRGDSSVSKDSKDFKIDGNLK